MLEKKSEDKIDYKHPNPIPNLLKSHPILNEKHYRNFSKKSRLPLKKYPSYIKIFYLLAIKFRFSAFWVVNLKPKAKKVHRWKIYIYFGQSTLNYSKSFTQSILDT